jgi:hypothetical protein
VDEFNDRRGIDMPLARMSTGAGGEKHQKGAQALAAGVNDVGGDLVDQRYFAMQTLFDDPINGLKVCGYQSTNLF